MLAYKQKKRAWIEMSRLLFLSYNEAHCSLGPLAALRRLRHLFTVLQLTARASAISRSVALDEQQGKLSHAHSCSPLALPSWLAVRRHTLRGLPEPCSLFARSLITPAYLAYPASGLNLRGFAHVGGLLPTPGHRRRECNHAQKCLSDTASHAILPTVQLKRFFSCLQV